MGAIEKSPILLYHLCTAYQGLQDLTKCQKFDYVEPDMENTKH